MRQKLLTLFTLVWAMVWAQSAFGQITFTPIEIPGTLSIPGMKNCYYSWTATQDCTIKQSGTDGLNWFLTYTEEMDTRVPFDPTETAGFGSAMVKTYDVEAGTTYYLQCFLWDAATVTLEYKGTDDPQGPEFVSVTPPGR